MRCYNMGPLVYHCPQFITALSLSLPLVYHCPQFITVLCSSIPKTTFLPSLKCSFIRLQISTFLVQWFLFIKVQLRNGLSDTHVTSIVKNSNIIAHCKNSAYFFTCFLIHVDIQAITLPYRSIIPTLFSFYLMFCIFVLYNAITINK